MRILAIIVGALTVPLWFSYSSSTISGKVQATTSIDSPIVFMDDPIPEDDPVPVDDEPTPCEVELEIDCNDFNCEDMQLVIDAYNDDIDAAKEERRRANSALDQLNCQNVSSVFCSTFRQAVIDLTADIDAWEALRDEVQELMDCCC